MLSFVQPAVLSYFESAKPAVLTDLTEPRVLATQALGLLPWIQLLDLPVLITQALLVPPVLAMQAQNFQQLAQIPEM